MKTARPSPHLHPNAHPDDGSSDGRAEAEVAVMLNPHRGGGLEGEAMERYEAAMRALREEW